MSELSSQFSQRSNLLLTVVFALALDSFSSRLDRRMLGEGLQSFHIAHKGRSLDHSRPFQPLTAWRR